MTALTVTQMRDAEATACAAGWTEHSLIELAGSRLGHAIGRYVPHPGTLIGYLGKGHNAADALVAMRILRDHYQWTVNARCASPIDQLAPLTHTQWQQLGLTTPLARTPELDTLRHPVVLLDGLLGIGGRGALSPTHAALAAEMKLLRDQSGARVVAIDLPSGLDADTGDAALGTVTADITFMIGNPKLGLLTAAAAHFTGALALVTVPPLTHTGNSPMALIAPQTMTIGKSPRGFDTHKGMAGHVGIIAGSPTYTGAAVLAATGALRGGAGLVTLWVPPEMHSLIAAKCPPEVIVRSSSIADACTTTTINAWVVGCGLGIIDDPNKNSLLEFLATTNMPVVIDADALNLISSTKQTSMLKANHVITPHPGEFRRLAPDLADFPREQAARLFADRCPATLLLKGCRSLVTRAAQPLWCNATGGPAMATGGHGDLLAGVIGAQLAVAMPPLAAASYAAWLCGRSAEICIQSQQQSEQSLIPSDIANQLGKAFNDWQTSSR